MAAKLGGLVRARWGDGDRRPAPFPGGAALAEGERAWILLDRDPDRRLGAALAWARKQEIAELHLLADDAVAAGVLARRAALFTSVPQVWTVRERELDPTAPGPYPERSVLAPEAELLRVAALAAGTEAVVEQGELIAEVLGLEVARTRTDEAGVHLDIGVGRFDQEAFAMMNPDLPHRDAVEKAAGVVRGHRRRGAPRHPLNQLAPERWLRAVVVADPALVGAASLEPVEPSVPRRNLKDLWPASAAGVGLDGEPLVVTCATATDLELVPCGADDRAWHRPGARLVLVVGGHRPLPATTAQADGLRLPAEVVSLPDPWASA